MKKIIYLILAVILSVSNSFSQQTITFLDSVSCKPIEFFAVFSVNEKYLCMGNAEGEIIFSKELLKEHDTIIFYHISYPQTKFATKNIRNTVKITAKNYNIECVNIKAKKTRYRNIKAGCLGKSWGSNIMSPTAQTGIYINNSYKDKFVQIKEMFIYIENSFFDPTQMFRIHLYHGNYNEQIGNDILEGKNIYANAKKGGSWVKIDLDSLNLYMPKDGIIATVECLGSKKSNTEFDMYYQKQHKKTDNSNIFKHISKEEYLKRIRYGFVIPSGKGCVNCENNNVNWGKNGLGEWSKERGVQSINPSIYLKLRVKK